MVRLKIKNVMIALLFLVSIVFITLYIQSNHKEESLQEKIDSQLSSSLSALDSHLSRGDLSSFILNLDIIRAAASKFNTVADLSSFNHEEDTIHLSTVSTLLESVLLNIDVPEMKLSQTQLEEFQGLIKSLAENPENSESISNLYNFLALFN